MELVTLAEIEAAADRLAGTVQNTPIDTSRTFARRADAASVHLKLETLQRTGSFKIRGATNRMGELSEAELSRGVVAASAGNHAQGVALAARAQGADATIVMPEVTPAAKIAATRSYGADVEIHGAVYQESYERARAIADERGATFVHPFDDRAVIAGQGTLGLEIAQQVPDVDAVLVAVGGGGLISGIASAVTASTDARVIGVQTEGADHMARSLAAGEIYERDSVDTIAEGIGASRTEAFTFEHVRERVDRVVTVTDEAVCRAMALAAERAKLVTESAGAVALAALLETADGERVVDVSNETVAVPVCGANIDLTTFGEYTRRGLAAMDRYTTIRVAVADWPADGGAIADACAHAGASIDRLQQVPATGDATPEETVVAVTVETSGPDHRDRVRGTLAGADGCRLLDGDS